MTYPLNLLDWVTSDSHQVLNAGKLFFFFFSPVRLVTSSLLEDVCLASIAMISFPRGTNESLALMEDLRSVSFSPQCRIYVLKNTSSLLTFMFKPQPFTFRTIVLIKTWCGFARFCHSDIPVGMPNRFREIRSLNLWVQGKKKRKWELNRWNN